MSPFASGDAAAVRTVATAPDARHSVKWRSFTEQSVCEPAERRSNGQRWRCQLDRPGRRSAPAPQSSPAARPPATGRSHLLTYSNQKIKWNHLLPTAVTVCFRRGAEVCCCLLTPPVTTEQRWWRRRQDAAQPAVTAALIWWHPPAGRRFKREVGSWRPTCRMRRSAPLCSRPTPRRSPVQSRLASPPPSVYIDRW